MLARTSEPVAPAPCRSCQYVPLYMLRVVGSGFLAARRMARRRVFSGAGLSLDCRIGCAWTSFLAGFGTAGCGVSRAVRRSCLAGAAIFRISIRFGGCGYGRLVGGAAAGWRGNDIAVSLVIGCGRRGHSNRIVRVAGRAGCVADIYRYNHRGCSGSGRASRRGSTGFAARTSAGPETDNLRQASERCRHVRCERVLRSGPRSIGRTDLAGSRAMAENNPGLRSSG